MYYSVFAFLLVVQGTQLTYLVFAKKLYWGDLALQDLLVYDVLLALLNETALLILQVNYLTVEPCHPLAQVSVARLDMSLYLLAEYLRVPDGF